MTESPGTFKVRSDMDVEGTVTAERFIGMIDTGDPVVEAIKATYDSEDQNISGTYIKGISTQDHLTVTTVKGDGTAGPSVTIKDTVGGTGLSTVTQGTTDTLSVIYGNAADTACEGNDTRLSDAREPTPHAWSSGAGYGVASTSDFGHVKIGSNITVDGGTVSLTGSNVDAALGYTAVDPSSLDTALNTKVDKVEGSSLMTSAEHTKLAGIASGAQVNVIETIKVNTVAQTITDKTVNITVPTNNDQLTNGAGYQTSSDVSAAITANNANYYTKTEVDSKGVSVFRYKGVKETYAQLPTEDVAVGDVWDITTADPTHGINAGGNVVCSAVTPAITWDALSGVVDLSAYYTSAQTDTLLADKITKNTAITGATKCKVTYDSKGLVTAGADLQESDIPALSISKVTGLQTALDGKQSSGNYLTSSQTRNVTVSTSAPSGGSSGDIWIQYGS